MSSSENLPTGPLEDPSDPRIEIRRSRRRTRTVQARMEGEKMVVLMPAGLSAAREDELVRAMLRRMARSRRRVGTRAGDAELLERCLRLSREYLGGRAVPSSVRWVSTMRTRWASCSQDSGAIRVSEELRAVPGYVLDYVLVHEAAHLLVPGGHPPEFWELVRAYPRTERAMGYLEAMARMPRGTHAHPEGPGGARPTGEDPEGEHSAGGLPGEEYGDAASDLLD